MKDAAFVTPQVQKVRMGKGHETFARRQREIERKRKAAEKIARRRQKAADAKAEAAPEGEEPLTLEEVETATEA